MTTKQRGQIDTSLLDAFVGYQVRRVGNGLDRSFSEAMAGTEIRQVLFGVLALIAANPGINQGSIADALEIKRANIVGLIAELEERDLITRVVVPSNRRAFALTLTAAGSAMVADCLARIGAHEDRLLANLSSAERIILIGLLRRLA
ncbi:MarR family winged helix-turn-helix transcriptional regulator [Sphingomonas sp. CFBP 8760]|uniref:MarR family winged helix-turn-helix transcriptional regulator n=1 Tax=Sphingomonas sp. CFBP 8760 TaxID=2775282 RepID=UPI00314520A8